MKVALIFPELYEVARFYGRRKEFPPFSVLYLGAVLEKNNIEVELFSVNPDKVILNLKKFNIIAFSIPSSITYHIIKKVREKSIYSTNTLLIAGGVHATIYPKETLKDLKIDVVGIGVGEETILEIINEFHSRNFSKINGVCYIRNNITYYTPTRKLKRDLDYLPVIPARHLLPKSDFIMTNRLSDTNLKMTHVMFARGCPYSCNFCASQQKTMQYRSGQHIRKELIHLIKTYSIEGFAETGDNFLVDKEKVRNICNTIADLNLKWSTLSRVDTVERNVLERMYNAGCIEIKFGIESGSNKMLKAMGKNISLNQIYNAIKITKSIGIKNKIFLIHGYPGENMETTNETIKLLKRLSSMIDRISLFRFVPLPGSYIYKNYKENKLLISNTSEDWDKSHIYHNHYHWWGTKKDFEILSKSYKKLDKFIADNWK